MISPALDLIYDLLQFRVDPRILLVLGPYFSSFWSILDRFGRFLPRVDPSSDPVLRVSSLLQFESAGRRASAMVDVLNTVRAIQVHQAHDASWSLGLLRQAATPEVVLVDFRPLFGPIFFDFHPSNPIYHAA